MGHNGTFFGKSFRIFLFSFKKAFRDEKRKIGVHMSSILEHFIECLLHFFPDGVSMWFNYHAPSYRTMIGEVCLNHYIVVPFTIILLARRNDIAHKIL